MDTYEVTAIGELFKKSPNGQRKWNLREFALSRTTLIYYKEKDKRGEWDISECKVRKITAQEARQPAAKFAIAIEGKNKQYILNSDTEQNRDFWVNLLQKQIYEFRNPVRRFIRTGEVVHANGLFTHKKNMFQKSFIRVAVTNFPRIILLDPVSIKLIGQYTWTLQSLPKFTQLSETRCNISLVNMLNNQDLNITLENPVNGMQYWIDTFDPQRLRDMEIFVPVKTPTLQIDFMDFSTMDDLLAASSKTSKNLLISPNKFSNSIERIAYEEEQQRLSSVQDETTTPVTHAPVDRESSIEIRPSNSGGGGAQLWQKDDEDGNSESKQPVLLPAKRRSLIFLNGQLIDNEVPQENEKQFFSSNKNRKSLDGVTATSSNANAPESPSSSGIPVSVVSDATTSAAAVTDPQQVELEDWVEEEVDDYAKKHDAVLVRGDVTEENDGLLLSLREPNAERLAVLTANYTATNPVTSASKQNKVTASSNKSRYSNGGTEVDTKRDSLSSSAAVSYSQRSLKSIAGPSDGLLAAASAGAEWSAAQSAREEAEAAAAVKRAEAVAAAEETASLKRAVAQAAKEQAEAERTALEEERVANAAEVAAELEKVAAAIKAMEMAAALEHRQSESFYNSSSERANIDAILSARIENNNRSNEFAALLAGGVSNLKRNESNVDMHEVPYEGPDNQATIGPGINSGRRNADGSPVYLGPDVNLDKFGVSYIGTGTDGMSSGRRNADGSPVYVGPDVNLEKFGVSYIGTGTDGMSSGRRNEDGSPVYLGPDVNLDKFGVSYIGTGSDGVKRNADGTPAVYLGPDVNLDRYGVSYIGIGNDVGTRKSGEAKAVLTPSQIKAREAERNALMKASYHESETEIQYIGGSRVVVPKGSPRLSNTGTNIGGGGWNAERAFPTNKSSTSTQLNVKYIGGHRIVTAGGEGPSPKKEAPPSASSSS